MEQQQVALQSVIDEKQNAIRELETNFGREQEKTKVLERKLELSNQLLTSIYGELSKSFEAGLMSGQNGHAPLIDADEERSIANNAYLEQQPAAN